MNRKSVFGFCANSNYYDFVFSENYRLLIQMLGKFDISVIESSHLQTMINTKNNENSDLKNNIHELQNFQESVSKSFIDLYDDPNINYIFDLSGGDTSNFILDLIDYEKIKNSTKIFCGYSDLTTIINAIYTKTNKKSILFQISNLIKDESRSQFSDFISFVDFNNNTKDLAHSHIFVSPKCYFLQQSHLEGVVVGGNIRCLLKLVGTPYFPDLIGKILLLEAYHGLYPQLLTYFSQLKQIGAFEKISGILLGRFLEFDKKGCDGDLLTLLKPFVSQNLPIARTLEIGHNLNSKGIIIGEKYCFNEK